MLRHIYRDRPSAWKGIVGGLAGGLAATVVMSQFQNAWTKAAEALVPKNNHKASKEESTQESEDATMKVAGKLAEKAGVKLSRAKRKKIGPAIHYGFGTAMGLVYGLSREFAPRPVRAVHPLTAGLGYGAALFVGADEVVVPALGLSDSPKDTSLGDHLYGLASHLVYGITLEVVRKNVRTAL